MLNYLEKMLREHLTPLVIVIVMLIDPYTNAVLGDELKAIPRDFDKRFADLKKESIELQRSKDFEACAWKQEELVNLASQYFPPDHWLVMLNKADLASTKKRLSLTIEQQEKVDLANRRVEGGKLFVQERSFAKAIAFYEDALQSYRETVGERDVATLDCLHELSLAQMAAGYFDDAWNTCEPVTRTTKEMFGIANPQTAARQATLSQIAFFRKDYRQSAALIDEAIEGLAAAGQLEFHEHARLLIGKAMVLNATGRFEEALVAAQRGSSIVAMHEPRRIGVLLQAQAEIAAAYLGSNRPNECILVFRRMKPLQDQHPEHAPTGNEYKRWLTIYHDGLIKLNRIEEAESVRKRIQDIK